jgi:hypothetical protein
MTCLSDTREPGLEIMSQWSDNIIECVGYIYSSFVSTTACTVPYFIKSKMPILRPTIILWNTQKEKVRSIKF